MSGVCPQAEGRAHFGLPFHVLGLQGGVEHLYLEAVPLRAHLSPGVLHLRADLTIALRKASCYTVGSGQQLAPALSYPGPQREDPLASSSSACWTPCSDQWTSLVSGLVHYRLRLSYD